MLTPEPYVLAFDSGSAQTQAVQKAVRQPSTRCEAPGVQSPELLRVLETYYDTAPRAAARIEEIGPFTLFVKADPAGWPYYARPRLGLETDITATDIAAVRERQVELGLAQAFEWVHETTPGLLEPARAAGLVIHECPLLVLPQDVVAGGVDPSALPDAVEVRPMQPDAPDLDEVLGAINAGFAGVDDITPGVTEPLQRLLRDGRVVLYGAFDEHGAIGGGSHSPRGTTTELTGIAVLPRARRRGVGAAITKALVSDAKQRGVETIFLGADDDAVARVYERVGFVRVGTACVAEASVDTGGAVDAEADAQVRTNPAD